MSQERRYQQYYVTFELLEGLLQLRNDCRIVAITGDVKQQVLHRSITITLESPNFKRILEGANPPFGDELPFALARAEDD